METLVLALNIFFWPSTFNRTNLEWKQFLVEQRLAGRRTFNRTNLEWKHSEQEGGYIFNSLLLIAPIWNGNEVAEHLLPGLKFPFNRTNLEWKLISFSCMLKSPATFNRTNLEWKQVGGIRTSVGRRPLLIAPIWNGNEPADDTIYVVSTTFNRTNLEWKREACFIPAAARV